jgi:hypothetical protein
VRVPALQQSAGNRAVTGLLQRALLHDPNSLGAIKLLFEGDSYHRGVKQAAIEGVGLKTLRKIMRSNKAKNFNFWFEKDGEIFVDDNSDRSDKGKPTGFRWEGGKVVKLDSESESEAESEEDK